MNNEFVSKAAFFATGAIAGGIVGYIVGSRMHRGEYIEGVEDYIFTDRVNQVEDYIEKVAETIDGLGGPVAKYSKTFDDKPPLDAYLKERINDKEEDMSKFVGAITEKMYEEDDDYEKLTGTYFKNEHILAGFNDDFEEIDPEEIGTDAWEYIANSDAKAVYFKNEDESRKYEIIITTDSYDDAYEEFLANEVSSKENGEE